MTVPPILFDRKLARTRLLRATRPNADFLRQAVVAEIEDRGRLILRNFERTLACGLPVDRLPAQFGQVTAAGRDVQFDTEALPFAPESFDCVLSVLDLQGMNDLPGALAQMRRILKPDGLLLACLFAGETLAELRQAWLEAETHRHGGVTPRVAPMAGLSELGSLLQRVRFALPVIDVDRTTVRYASALALMREIKALGLSNTLADRSRKPVTRALLAQAAEAYERHDADADGRIRATVDIAWMTAWAPHESQPRALKPGSAKARLADALKAEEVRIRR